MVKLKKIPTFFSLKGRERNLEMALDAVNASLIAIVICLEHLDSFFLM